MNTSTFIMLRCVYFESWRSSYLLRYTKIKSWYTFCKPRSMWL